MLLAYGHECSWQLRFDPRDLELYVEKVPSDEAELPVNQCIGDFFACSPRNEIHKTAVTRLAMLLSAICASPDTPSPFAEQDFNLSLRSAAAWYGFAAWCEGNDHDVRIWASAFASLSAPNFGREIDER